jgi:hypothetical protein
LAALLEERLLVGSPFVLALAFGGIWQEARSSLFEPYEELGCTM